MVGTVSFKPSGVVDVFVWRVWGVGGGGHVTINISFITCFRTFWFIFLKSKIRRRVGTY